MVVVCLFCVQTTLVSLDRIEHALEHDHNATPLAGTVTYCSITPEVCNQSTDPSHSVSHVHSGDTVTNLLQATGFAYFPVEFTPATFLLAGDQSSSNFTQSAPDRPPKA